MRIAIPTALTLALLAAVPAAAPAAVEETAYDVVFDAQTKERWDFREFTSSECTVGTCVREELGSGTAATSIRTPTPQRVTVLTGVGPTPQLVGTNEGTLQVTAAYLRTGSHTTTYSGGWDAANPDVVDPTDDCGRRTVKRTTLALSFQERNRIAPTTGPEPLREKCPSGPSQLNWDDGTVPDLNAIVVTTAQSKFGRLKQFTVSGQRTWHGTVPPMNRTDPQDTFLRSGGHEVTWQWRATFRKAKKKRRR
jgi:hypothetical protein